MILQQKKLLNYLKKDTFNIIQNNPERLLEIEGIGKKKVDMITNSFVEQIDIKEIMMFLQNHSISTTYGVKIYKQYGKNTISNISENPYRLTDDIYGIGFKLADKIAYSLGVEKESPFRTDSGIKYVLSEYAASGNSYVPYKILLDSVCNLLEISIEIIESEMRNMAFQGKIHIENIKDEKVVYYLPYHIAEVNVCKNLINLDSTDFDISEEEILHFLSLIENESYIELTKMQKEAVLQSILNGVTVITGGPGTGKTTIIHTIIRVFEMMNKKNTSLCSNR